MAKIVLTAVVIVLLNVLVGCQGIDSGRGQLMPSRTMTSVGSAVPHHDVGRVCRCS